MTRYLCRQILSALLTLFCITAILYFMLSVVRGGPLDVLRSSGLSASELEAMRRSSMLLAAKCLGQAEVPLACMPRM